jgi:methylglyoxal synthase
MKYIALIAHDRMKQDLVNWVKENLLIIQKSPLIATESTGKLIMERTGLKVDLVESGPMGGDVMIANHILLGNVEKLIFFIDTQAPHPHDPDIRTLTRIATIKNIPFAMNRATADYLVK